MTSSDATALRPGELAELASAVGRVVDAAPAGTTRVAAVCAKFNGGITARLLRGLLAGLQAHGVDPATVLAVWVPGAFELPLAASHLARSGTVDAVVALGAVIRGDTAHFDFVAGECARGLARVALDEALPVVFGVLTTDTVGQALERCAEGPANKGYEAVVCALEMVGLRRRLFGGTALRAAAAAGPARAAGR